MTKLTYTGDEVQKLLDKIEAGDFDNAKTLEGHPASYFAKSEAFTALLDAFVAEQEDIDALQGYFTNGKANDALKLGGQLPAYYATATDLTSLTTIVTEFKALFDSLFEKDTDNNAIKAKLSLYSLGGLTAGGVGSDSSSGSGSSYSRLDSWGDYSADKAGYVLSALLGNELNQRLTTVEGAGYITQSALANYALRSELPSLAGYATESFVTSQGYITASALNSYATQSWVEGKGYITGITSAMVVTALGYTPYDSANFTKPNIQSTLGISDWALASAKPSYAWSEITSRPTALSQFIDDVVSGNYLPLSGGTLSSSNREVLTLNTPDTLGPLIFLSVNGTRFAGLGVLPKSYDEQFGTVLTNVEGNNGLLLGSDGKAYFVASETSLLPRYELFHSGNYSSLLANGTINGSLTLNQTLYTKAVSGSEWVASGFFISSSGFPVGVNSYGGCRWGGFDEAGGLKIQFGSESAKIEIIDKNWSKALFWVNTNGDTFASGSITASSFIGNLTGNADSATKLATARTIWGQSFDGTGDITGALTAPSVTVGSISLTYDATNSALCVNGNFYATGGVTAGGPSDARLKQNVATMTEQKAISTIMALRPVTFEWNALARSHDGRLYGNSQGFIAQEFERLIENSGRAIYGHYRAIDTTKAIPYLTTVAQNHERRISDLERENKALREKVEHLRKVA